VVGGCLEDASCAQNPFFSQFTLNEGDPIVFNNHFPLARQAPPVPAPAMSRCGMVVALLFLSACALLALRRLRTNKCSE